MNELSLIRMNKNKLIFKFKVNMVIPFLYTSDADFLFSLLVTTATFKLSDDLNPHFTKYSEQLLL